ncbi:MAG: tetratricopeptide repeat protein [Rhodospirillaceae bacterium]|nr:tetratricopeptide repeat protein [Rhodospirillaceae bacterium]
MNNDNRFGRVSMRVLTLACALAFGAAVLPQSITVAVAQEKEKAAKGPSVGNKVGKPLKAAQEAMAAKNWKEAKLKIDEANAVDGKTPYETFAVTDMLAFVQVNLADYAGAAKSYESTINSEFVTADQKPGRAKSIAQLFYQTKNYAKVTTYGPMYLKDNPSDSDMQMMVGQAYYLQNDFPNSAKYLKAAIDTAEKAGKTPKEDWLQLLMSSEYEQNNVPGLTNALQKIVAIYPKPQYWEQLIQMNEKEINDSGKFDLEIYRIRMAVGAKMEPDEYREIAELAIQAGLPGEAQKAMELAAASGAKTERDTRLTTMAKTQADSDKKTLAQSEASAANAATGEPLVKTGEAYLTYGNPTKAIELIQAGLKKGPKDADRAKLRLGVAQLEAKQSSEARRTFNSIPAASPYGKLAKMWALVAASR